MILIRADANKTIASGHIMRMMAVGEACKKLGEEVCFILADNNPVKMLEQRGFSYQIMNTEWNCLEGELKILKEYIKILNPSVLLIDSYFVTERYFRELNNEKIRVAYIDDLNLFQYPVDIVIRYSLMDNIEGYLQQYIGVTTKVYYGTKYTPLRKEFGNQEVVVRKNIKNILVSTGATDPLHIEKQIRNALREYCLENKVKLNLIRGALTDIDSGEGEQNQDISYAIEHRNVTNMATLMRNCDLAISAGGTTIYELCAMGLPTIAFTMADNQVENMRIMQQLGVISYAGDVRINVEKTLSVIKSLITNTMNEYEYRKKISTKMRKLTDGTGAEQIAIILTGKKGKKDENIL